VFIIQMTPNSFDTTTLQLISHDTAAAASSNRLVLDHDGSCVRTAVLTAVKTGRVRDRGAVSFSRNSKISKDH